MKVESFFSQDINTERLLNSVGENLIIADKEFQIIWMNEKAKQLLDTLAPFVNKTNADDFINLNLFSFHNERQIEILKNGPFPHHARIKLFNRFSAEILIDILKSTAGEDIGIILTWKDVTDIDEERREAKRQLETLYTPIISTALDAVKFVVLSGILTEERLVYTQEKILQACTESESEYVIFDFTGINQVMTENMAFLLNQLATSLKLIGVEPIFSGLNADLVREIVTKGFNIEIKSFLSFQQGINYIWNRMGYKLEKIK